MRKLAIMTSRKCDAGARSAPATLPLPPPAAARPRDRRHAVPAVRPGSWKGALCRRTTRLALASALVLTSAGIGGAHGARSPAHVSPRGRRRLDRYLSELSETLAGVHADNADSAIADALGRIGSMLDVDLVSLAEISTGSGEVTVQRSWSAGSTDAPPLGTEGVAPPVGSRVWRGEGLYVSRPSDLPGDAYWERQALARLRLHSAAILPLAADGVVNGILALGTTHRQLDWSPTTTEQLHRLAAVLAVALRHRGGEQRALRSEALAVAILDAQEARIAVIDRAGTIVAVNERWRRFARENSAAGDDSAFVGANYLAECRRAARLGSDAAEQAAAGIQSVLDGATARSRYEYLCPTAAADLWFEMLVEPIRRPDGGAVVSHRDITDRRRAEAEATQRRREALHMARVGTIGGLAASLAHELNQPLTAIRTNAYAATRFMSAEPMDVREMRDILADIASDVTRAGAVMERMRNLLRDGAPQLVELDLNESVRAAARLVANDALIRRALVRLVLQPGLPTVSGDEVQLQQVVLNLIVNGLEALDRGDRGDGRVVVRTRLATPADVVLTVSDTGPGVEPGGLRRIFEPFYTTKRAGLGVGLSISRSIVEAHGGSMWAENNSDGGASVHVMLPASAGKEPGDAT